jgi:alkanesulfonate monooxygenase SsuD/methylene tetrahydromethanopterin reductase-like flavin-dependent oxidoreductase (luciferase family)
MRFAFKTTPQNTTWSDMLAVWQQADDIDVYESGWTFDHFYPIFTDSTGPCLEGWTTLTALAEATTRLRLGTMVSGIHYRHPAVLANMAAALNIISNGRHELGIGAGSNIEVPTASSWAPSGSAWIASKRLVRSLSRYSAGTAPPSTAPTTNSRTHETLLRPQGTNAAASCGIG